MAKSKSSSKLDVYQVVQPLLDVLNKMDLTDRVEALNGIRKALHDISPFKAEPVDCVIWVKSDQVTANDYNPNAVAPVEMRLLEHSINEDGYTQPIVAWSVDRGTFEVVDGFHRHRVGKESKSVTKRIHGYLPLVHINVDRTARNDRIAATIRHNRARGKHKIDAMSDIVVELKKRNWSDERICKELGMDEDEVLRLCQISGLAELFSDQEFSKAWDVEGQVSEVDFAELSDDIGTYGDEADDFRTVNTSDRNRIFHTYEKWECYKAGFYSNTPPKGMTKAQCEAAYGKLMTAPKKFEKALSRVITEWKNSCEHYLTNSAMNRIAWLGQAAVCISEGVPSVFRTGFSLMTESQRNKADRVALKYLNNWLRLNKMQAVSMEEATSYGRESDIY